MLVQELILKEIKDHSMGLIYKVSDKELLGVRNEIFKSVGIPSLLKNGFELDPFNTSWHGQYDKNIKGCIYQFSRLREQKYLERIEVFILNGEKWIQIYLNIFELQPKLGNLLQLNQFEGIKFGIAPNSSTKMRLRSDDYKGPPLFYMLFLPEYKIGKFNTKKGFEIQIEKLKNLIKTDMEDIDSFVERWHELHKPNITDWEGNITSKASY